MNQGALHVARRGRFHHEASVGCPIETHAGVSVVHASDDFVGIEQNDKMLGQEPQTVHDQVLLGKPDSTTVGNAELRPNHSDVYIRQFVGTREPSRRASYREFGNGRKNHLCRGMERRQFCLRAGSAFDIVCHAAGIWNLRMLHSPRPKCLHG